MPELPEPPAWLDYLQPALQSNWFTNFGPVNTAFEARLGGLYAQPGESVITASNATAGLSACLIAEAVAGPVLCPAFTFQATAGAILGAHCTPVIVDVDSETGVVAPQTLAEGFRETGARAAIVLAPYGIGTDFRAHAALCHEMGRILIIDNAAGLGVTRGNRAIGGAADVVREVYSLHATKPFGIGEGGAIFAPSAREASLRAALNFGLQSHSANGAPQPPWWGINGKMAEIHAAIGLAVADTMEARVARRQQMAARWLAGLADAPVSFFGTRIETAPWQVFPVLLASGDHVLATIECAAGRGIELRRYYSPSLGACSGMASLGPCANAHHLAERAMVLPVRSTMAADEQEDLIATVRACIRAGHDRRER